MKRVLVTFIVAIFATVTFGQVTKTEIKVNELPKCTIDWIKKEMRDYNPERALKVVTKTPDLVTICYNVKLTNAKTGALQWVSFCSDCAKIKKISEKEALADPKPPKSKGGAPAPAALPDPKKQ